MGTESGVGTGLWVQVGVLACCSPVLGGEQMVGAASNEHPPTLLPSPGCLSPCLWLKSAPPPPTRPGRREEFGGWGHNTSLWMLPLPLAV